MTISETKSQVVGGKVSKVFTADGLKTIEEYITRIVLVRPSHGPSIEIERFYNMKNACLDTISQVNPQLLSVDDAVKK